MVHTRLREVEAAFEHGFPLVFEHIQHTIDGPTQVGETETKCSGYKRQSPPWDGLSRAGSGKPGRSRWKGAPDDKQTLVAACRDVFRVIRAEPGSGAGELKPAIDEIEILSGELEVVWHDGWRRMRHSSTITRDGCSHRRIRDA